MESKINYEEWLALVEREQAKAEEGFTMAELSAAIRHSPRWISSHILVPGIANGQVTTGRRRSHNVAGQRTWTPTYRLIIAEEE